MGKLGHGTRNRHPLSLTARYRMKIYTFFLLQIMLAVANYLLIYIKENISLKTKSEYT